MNATVWTQANQSTNAAVVLFWLLNGNKVTWCVWILSFILLVNIWEVLTSFNAISTRLGSFAKRSLTCTKIWKEHKQVQSQFSFLQQFSSIWTSVFLPDMHTFCAVSSGLWTNPSSPSWTSTWPSHPPVWDPCSRPQSLQYKIMFSPSWSICNTLVSSTSTSLLQSSWNNRYILVYLLMFSMSRESTTDFLISSLAMALSKAFCFTILLHSWYFILASLSFGRTFTTCHQKREKTLNTSVNHQLYNSWISFSCVLYCVEPLGPPYRF